MVQKTIHLRSRHVKDLINKIKKMKSVENTINTKLEKSDLIVIIDKLPTLVSIR
ncbi:hypothetical protein I5F07_04645 [Proteus vulgaris]|jgi:hypothetical protein|uniref:Uncharacterized protein n=1 Tax=Proteus vulgaris TaxID=585 RepID=A0A379F5J8_PROVU|nr:hypothetical protein [Proteus vulgaris]KGA59251.1 hypothetical protein DR95_1333 [Proteus vulgaris]MBG5984156.1 hypothetical protein [Proteus vulgaris]SUC14672.1 Uncharacterised protein [Proteus vulgaris]VTP71113.1 Uncharacterised protein [Proteus vulgaris]